MIKYHKELPTVLFSSFSLFNKQIEVGKEYDGNTILKTSLESQREVSLKYNQNVFSISFATDNFILPEKTQYSYRLEGFNKEWLTLPAGVNTVAFTGLPSGKYILKVKAINSAGYEGTDIAQLPIVIHPPFWFSTWAYILYSLIAIVLLWLALHHLLKKEREKFRVKQI